jgi:membrane associated rhomboid family serine protease
MSILVLLAVMLGAAAYFLTAEERNRALKTARNIAQDVYEVCQGGPERFPFRAALQARTALAFITPSLIVVNMLTFALIVLDGPIGQRQTLISWGGNLGPLTTNGEWHRLLLSLFVHSGMLHLLANLAGLAAAGFIAERLVGSLTFASIYFASGLIASLVSVSVNPLGLSMGASGAIFGIYGLLFASSIPHIFRESDARIPLVIVKWLSPFAGAFLLYNLASSSVPREAELAGLVVGFVGGLVLTHGAAESKPRIRRIGAVTAATVVIAGAYAAPLAGIDDVRPNLQVVAAAEERTARLYETEVDRFRKGRTSADALVQTIDGTIIPELRAADARLKELDRVPDEQRPLVERAATFLRLREESWRLRADGLRQISALKTPNRVPQRGDPHKSIAMLLRNAETTELKALAVLRDLSSINQ